MIRIHPVPAVDFTCPVCGARLRPVGWLIPGMRTLADLTCPDCGRRFYGDLPAGFGLHYPMLIDAESGAVHDPRRVGWFARWLAESYGSRQDDPLPLQIERFRPMRRPLVLDCLDGLYGHALLKLLNAQRHLDRDTDRDVLILVPRALRWLVPDGVAETWTLDIPVAEGRMWSDCLARTLHAALDPYGDVALSRTVTHPDPRDFDIERFTRIAPRPIGDGTSRAGPAVVTFVWRDDRRWEGKGRDRQPRRLAALATALAAELPGIDVAVAGVASPNPRLSASVLDLRDPAPGEEREREWCLRYAASDLVVGVHGSNMLLPSALAAAAVELVPDDRQGNVGQSLLPRMRDPRDALVRYRLLPLDSDPRVVARIIATTIRELPAAERNFLRPFPQAESLPEDPSPPAERLDQRERAE